MIAFLVRLLTSFQRPRTHEATFPPLATFQRESFGEALTRIALGEEGIREEGNNGGPRIRDYQAATWLAVGAWPWCAAFICWIIFQARKERPRTTFRWKRPRTAAAWDFERWAREQPGVHLFKGDHLQQLLKENCVLSGDIIVFTFSHIGLATGGIDQGTIQTIEGNTNLAGSREGDGVYRRTRKFSQIRAIIRFAP